VRGVPLITVLFIARLLVPLVDPSLAEFPNVFRAMVGITLFSAAYLAENVRGGLQAVAPGQIEAAKALGLHNYQITLHITLPQALRAVIPALVGQFISLFKDTSLVAIIGLRDLLGIADSTLAQTEFLGLRREVFVFIIVIYFTVSYTMAVISRRIEASGSGRMAVARQL
jgi:general L-amino acid transport system permease protein